MNIKSVKNTNLILVSSIIIFSFLLSIFSINFYLNKYDKFEAFQNNNHPMLKIAVENHWSEANQIVQDFKSGKKFLNQVKLMKMSFYLKNCYLYIFL